MPAVPRCRDPYRPHRSAFTLIELVLTVAIMLLIASLLTATVASLRQYAGRVRCAATLKQAYEAFVLFSVENRGQALLTYTGSARQDNYYYYDSDNRGIGSSTAGAWGILFDRGYVDPQRGWFCPMNRNPQWTFKTTINPWPPKRGYRTRGNYGARPEVDENAGRFPRLSDYTTKAIITDICSEKVQMMDHHRTGMNVAYGDGSLRFQRLALYEAPYTYIPNGLGYAPAYNASFLKVWRLLDAN